MTGSFGNKGFRESLNYRWSSNMLKKESEPRSILLIAYEYAYRTDYK